MVPHGLKWVREACENRPAVVDYWRGLAMHQPRGASDRSTKSCADTLMAQTDPQDRAMAGELSQQRYRDTCFGRRAGSGGNHDRVRRECARGRNFEFIVAPHDYVSSKFTEILHQVISERVVVIDHQELWSHSRSLSLGGRTQAGGY